MSFRYDKNHIKDIFENLRTWGIHWTQYFFQKNKDFIQDLWKKIIFLWILIKYCWYPQFWHLTGESFSWVLYWLLIKVSFRYKIAHVWEENESLVIRYCGIKVSLRGYWKKSIETGHPVYCHILRIFHTLETTF